MTEEKGAARATRLQGLDPGAQAGDPVAHRLELGAQLGQALALGADGERRFSPLPGGVLQCLSAIDSAEELTRLAERVLSARSLEELGLA